MFKVKNRWQAFGTHILISLFIFIILLSIILFVWYPGIFINMGGYQGIKIVAGVDLVLGPVLTLMIFNPGKKAHLIKLDLCIIAAVQFSALTAGTWLVYKERPLVQVLSDDGVHVHSASELAEAEVNTDILRTIASSYPKKVFLDLPEDPKEANSIKFLSEFTEGKSVTLRTDLYKDLTKVAHEKIQARVQKSTKHNCDIVEINSFHFFGESCFDSTNGAYMLVKEAT